MHRAAIYCRVSTEEQANEGLSITAQKRTLTEYALRNGMVVVEEFIDEGVSAKTADRPQFQRMISLAKAKPCPFDVILIHKTDRFARNREDAIVYKSLLRRDCGIDVKSITEQFDDSPIGKLLEGILEVMAEFYSLNLSQEVMKGMKEKASQGKGVGMAPLGYRVSETGKYEIVPEEAAIVRFIFDTYVNDEGGLLAIAQTLHREGTLRFGEVGAKFKWSSVGIRNILKNPAYIGQLVWNRRDGAKKHRLRKKEDWVVVEDAHEPIIGKDQWELANKILKSRRGVRTPVEDYLLRGLAKCADCGGSMSYYRAQWRRKGGQKVINPELACARYFHSRTCYFNHVSISKIEQGLFAHLASILDGRVDANDIEITFPHLESVRAEIETYRRQLEATDAKFQRQLEAFEAGAIDLDDLKAARERVTNEKDSVRQRIAAMQSKLAPLASEHVHSLRNQIRHFLTTARNENLTPKERRQALNCVVDHVRYSRRTDTLDIVLKLAE